MTITWLMGNWTFIFLEKHAQCFSEKRYVNFKQLFIDLMVL